MIEKKINLTTLVRQIVTKLDRNDGEDGRIGAEEWKKFVKGKGETSIHNYIAISNAETKVKEYLTQKTNNSTEQADLAEKWFNKLMEEKPEINKSKNTDKNTKTTEKTENVKGDIDTSKKASAERLRKKWCGIWKNSGLSHSFFEKLFDIIPKINLKVNKFDNKNFASPEEQIADRLCCLFAQEARLNPTTKTSLYAGLFQLGTDTIPAVKKSAEKAEVKKLMTDKKNFTGLKGFASLSGEQQLDWLIAFCDCKNILNMPKTVEELAAKIKCISQKNANKHNCSSPAEYAGKILDSCMKTNKVPVGSK